MTKARNIADSAGSGGGVEVARTGPAEVDAAGGATPHPWSPKLPVTGTLRTGAADRIRLKPSRATRAAGAAGTRAT